MPFFSLPTRRLAARALISLAAAGLAGCANFNQALSQLRGLAAQPPTATAPAPTQPPGDPPTPTPIPPTLTPVPNVRVSFALVRDVAGTLAWAELPVKPPRVPGVGLRPAGGTFMDIAFAVPGTPPNTLQRYDTAGSQPLAGFVPNHTLAIEPVPVDGIGRLAWTGPTADGAGQAIYMGNVDGTGITQLLGPIGQVEVAGWSADGAAIYYAEEPAPAPADQVYPGVSSLFRFDLATSRVETLIPVDASRVGCIDDLAPDAASVVERCGTDKELVIRYLGGPTTTVQAPPTIPGKAAIGSARFSLDGRRIGFALTSTDLAEVISWVAVSDGLGGGATQVLQSQPNEQYSVVAWLGPTDLLIQAHLVGCAELCDALYVVNLESGDRVKFADGIFVAFSAARPD